MKVIHAAYRVTSCSIRTCFVLTSHDSASHDPASHSPVSHAQALHAFAPRALSSFACFYFARASFALTCLACSCLHVLSSHICDSHAVCKQYALGPCVQVPWFFSPNCSILFRHPCRFCRIKAYLSCCHSLSVAVWHDRALLLDISFLLTTFFLKTLHGTSVRGSHALRILHKMNVRSEQDIANVRVHKETWIHATQ